MPLPEFPIHDDDDDWFDYSIEWTFDKDSSQCHNASLMFSPFFLSLLL
jgi:hypothetical protein